MRLILNYVVLDNKFTKIHGKNIMVKHKKKWGKQ
jgi:hypothetical protein